MVCWVSVTGLEFERVARKAFLAAESSTLVAAGVDFGVALASAGLIAFSFGLAATTGAGFASAFGTTLALRPVFLLAAGWRQLWVEHRAVATHCEPVNRIWVRVVFQRELPRPMSVFYPT